MRAEVGATGQLGVGSGDVTPDNAVSGFEGRGRGAWLAESDDGSGCLLTENVGEFGGVTAFAEIDVDEVDSAGFDADEGLAWAGGWRGKIAKVRTSAVPVVRIWMACMGVGCSPTKLGFGQYLA